MKTLSYHSPTPAASLPAFDRLQVRFPLRANAALLLVLFVAGWALRRIPPWWTMAFWIACPLCLYPRWVCKGWKVWDTFLWYKIFSFFPIATLWCTSTRLGFFPNSVYRKGSVVILGANILEAAVADLVSSLKEGNRNWNHLNAISGLLLILGELPSLNTIETRNLDVAWSLGIPWIVGTYNRTLLQCYGFDCASLTPIFY